MRLFFSVGTNSCKRLSSSSFPDDIDEFDELEELDKLEDLEIVKRSLI